MEGREGKRGIGATGVMEETNEKLFAKVLHRIFLALDDDGEKSV